jgi:hypothetical protein
VICVFLVAVRQLRRGIPCLSNLVEDRVGVWGEIAMAFLPVTGDPALPRSLPAQSRMTFTKVKQELQVHETIEEKIFYPR